MNIPVILLNYNSTFDCRKSIGFLQRQIGADLEIIVVDNCSKSDEIEAAQKLCEESGITFLASKSNRGYNAGNNIGLRYAACKGYKYALIANPDMEFPQIDYILQLQKVLDEKQDVVVVGSDIVGPDGGHQNPMMPDGDWKQAFNWLTDLMQHSKQEVPNYIDSPMVNHYCNKLSGCCFLIRIDFLQSIDFFDENVFLYCEEAILSKLMSQAGKKMYYLSSATAIHRHIKSEKGNPVPRFKAWIDSRLYFEKKYNYQGCIQHILKVIGWKTYLFSYLIKHKMR